MVSLGSGFLDTGPMWVFIVLSTRLTGLFTFLPGIGTEFVPASSRLYAAMSIALVMTFTGLSVPQPEYLHEMISVLSTEFLLGTALGLLPSMVLGGLAVAGQVISGSIGLGQANLIDRSLGTAVPVLAKLKVQLGTLMFLSMDGHHALIRGATGGLGQTGIGMFRPGPEVAHVLSQSLIDSFHLAVVVSAPVLVSTLVSQFVLGLITKFVPQVNIFIISLPLSVGMGLYLTIFTLPPLLEHTADEFAKLEEQIGLILPQLVEVKTTP